MVQSVKLHPNRVQPIELLIILSVKILNNYQDFWAWPLFILNSLRILPTYPDHSKHEGIKFEWNLGQNVAFECLKRVQTYFTSP